MGSGEWETNAVGLVAEVDCTADGKPLCDANGVRGFPTLKYGDPTSLDDYSGGRDYDSLAKEEKKLEAAEEDFKTAVEGLQKTYQGLMEAKDAKIAAVKEAGLGLMKSVKAAKAKADKDEL